jgi:nicotinamide-nucleotide amidase
MNAEIVTIGTELLLGQIIDTNAAYLAKKLAEIGIDLSYHSTVGDEWERMEEVINNALSRSDVVITTGGIGPTEDDLTREVVARVIGKELIFQPHLMAQIEERFKARGFTMSPNNRKQAFIPEGSIPIENPKGTAPGFIACDQRGKVICSLPGVPRELTFLMENTVIPFLVKHFNLKGNIIHYKVLRVCGLTESGVDRQIGDLIRNCENPKIGLLASPGDIQIRIQAWGEDLHNALKLIQPIEDEIRKRLGILIYGVDEETLEGKVRALLDERGITLSIADSFTGGTIAQRLLSERTDKIIECIIAPENWILQVLKRRIPDLNVNIKEASDFIALSIASWVREEGNSDIGMAIFPVIKGNEGNKGSIETLQLIIGIVSEMGSRQYQFTIGGTWQENRHRASTLALDGLRKALIMKEV